MKIARHHIVSLAAAVMLMAGCAKAPVRTDRLESEDAQIARARAEFADAVRAANEEHAKAAAITAEQPARPDRAQAEPVLPARARAQAAKPERAETGAVLTPDQMDVAEEVASWAAAWSSKDVKGYLAAYAKNFAVPKGRSRQQWEADRRARIVGKSWIEVKIAGLAITVDGNIAKARFRQSYRSDKLSDNSSKTLVLVRTNEKWLIQQEW